MVAKIARCVGLQNAPDIARLAVPAGHLPERNVTWLSKNIRHKRVALWTQRATLFIFMKDTIMKLNDILLAIANGEFDSDMDTLKEALAGRKTDLKKLIQVGSRVRFTCCGPLHNVTATVLEIESEKLVVYLDLDIEEQHRTHHCHINIVDKIKGM
jgi:hypothetical protein